MKKKSVFTIFFIALVALSQVLLFSTLSNMSESNNCPLKVLMQSGDCATSGTTMSDHHLDVVSTMSNFIVNQSSAIAISIVALFLTLFFVPILQDRDEWCEYRKKHHNRFLHILLSLKKKYIRWLSYFNKGSIFSIFVGVNVN